MEGRPDPPSLRGIIPNSFQHIFEFVAAATDSQFLVRASYLEIYNEEIRDLLSKDPKNSLELKENIDSGVYVKDLTSFVVKNVAGKWRERHAIDARRRPDVCLCVGQRSTT